MKNVLTVTALLIGLFVSANAVADQTATKDECIVANLDDVKRVSLRIEYDANDWQGGPAYNGPIYVDNIVIK